MPDPHTWREALRTLRVQVQRIHYGISLIRCREMHLPGNQNALFCIRFHESCPQSKATTRKSVCIRSLASLLQGRVGLGELEEKVGENRIRM